MNTNSRQIASKLHWFLASFFVILWLSGDDWMSLHSFTGYGLLAVSTLFIIKRLLTGAFLKLSKPSFELKWQKSNLPLIMLSSLILAGLSGLLAQESGMHSMEDIHEFLANISLFLVGSHIALMLFGLLINKQRRQHYLQTANNFINNVTINKYYHWLLTQAKNITQLGQSYFSTNMKRSKLL